MEDCFGQPKRWLNEKAVAALTGLSVSCLQKWRFYGRGINYSKVGRSVRYSETDVIDFLEKNKIYTAENN